MHFYRKVLLAFMLVVWWIPPGVGAIDGKKPKTSCAVGEAVMYEGICADGNKVIFVPPDKPDDKPGKLQTIVNNAKEGDYIVLTAGDHLLASPAGLVIQGKSKLALIGAENARIKATSGYEILVFIKESKEIGLKDIHLVAENKEKPCCRFPVVGIYDAETIGLFDLVVKAGGAYAVGIARAKKVFIEGGEATGNTQGVFLMRNAKDVTIKDMVITDNGTQKNEAQSDIVKDNHKTQSDDVKAQPGGILDIYYSKDIKVLNNTITNNRTTYLKKSIDSELRFEKNTESDNKFAQDE
ncbi:right-handed parallel beta-helix repeat-containing protein [Candidatus Parabeggiatoa sp. HSG14]|uniref:right-handed parallel beta-helix repeat-containing protein n=1 Tax=Candidatus Parabeggiatoa sp. HSG14 TaxID=3055593 RepID=UPI0025A85FA1|nr:right-handed parallel beta-helix repeat-containing protein [Thiotrichales bacterium HSG14]